MVQLIRIQQAQVVNVNTFHDDLYRELLTCIVSSYCVLYNTFLHSVDIRERKKEEGGAKAWNQPFHPAGSAHLL